MMPQKAYRKVTRAFEKWDGTSDFSEFKKVVPEINKLIERNIRDIKRINVKWNIPDSLNEFDMYYENVIGNIDSEISNLHYISDRFNCVGRLKFLLKVIS